MGIAAVEGVIRENSPRRHAITVVAGVTDAAGRFGLPRFDRDLLDLNDDCGVALCEALQSQGLDPETLPGARWSADDIVACPEVAAEAGPVLERFGSPVGIILALSASSILRVTLTGQAVSTATVPMSSRRDALTGLADRILEAGRIGSARDGVTVAVVRIDVEPMPTFVVTDCATIAVCILSCDDAERGAIVFDLVAAFERIASRRQLEIAIGQGIDPAATCCDPGIIRLFEAADLEIGLNVLTRVLGTLVSRMDARHSRQGID